MFQRSPIARAQVMTGNTSENLLNVIKQIIYSFYRKKSYYKSISQYHKFNKVIK